MERWIFYIPPAAFGLAAFVLSRRSPRRLQFSICH